MNYGFYHFINSFGTSFLLLSRVSLEENHWILNCSGWEHYCHLKAFLSLRTLMIYSKNVRYLFGEMFIAND